MEKISLTRIIVLVLLASSFFAYSLPTAEAATANIGVDCSGIGHNDWGASVQVSLTTTTTNSLLYLSVANRQGKTVTGISSSPDLTWAKRGEANCYYNSGHMETWYAVWPSSGTITMTIYMSSSTTSEVVALGISGADTASPFDGDARTIGSTPGSAGPMDPTVSKSISTQNPNDLIIGAISVIGYSANPGLSPGSGFNLIRTQASSWTWIETSIECKEVSTIQSSLPVSYSLDSTGYGAMVVDAVKACVTQPTTLTVECTPNTVDRSGDMRSTVQGSLIAGTTGISSKSVALTYNDGANWQAIGTATTQSDGSYSFSWTVPSSLANGFYSVKADFTGDSNPYESSTAVTTSNPAGGGIFVVPEYIFGGLAALVACFVGFAIFKKRSSLPHFKPR